MLAWRNDPQSRAGSSRTEEVTPAEHEEWLAAMLASPDSRIYIAEENGVAVGTVRAERSDGAYRLSWTVAPTERGRGVGKTMVALVVDRLAGPLRAEVKLGNAASMRIAEHAGLELERRDARLLYYVRSARR